MPGARHDIGRFHRADGTFTGLYANLLTPVEGLEGADWTTTDLFLDVWLPANGSGARVLDEDELDDAVSRGWLDAATAAEATAEAVRLLADARAGAWPPDWAYEWTLARARAAIGHNAPPIG
jgi:predicted RNA-binding protein associated with RNAse of E/G family